MNLVKKGNQNPQAKKIEYLQALGCHVNPESMALCIILPREYEKKNRLTFGKAVQQLCDIIQLVHQLRL